MRNIAKCIEGQWSALGSTTAEEKKSELDMLKSPLPVLHVEVCGAKEGTQGPVLWLKNTISGGLKNLCDPSDVFNRASGLDERSYEYSSNSFRAHIQLFTKC